jgi:hypothetical protein
MSVGANTWTDGLEMGKLAGRIGEAIAAYYELNLH